MQATGHGPVPSRLRRRLLSWAVVLVGLVVHQRSRLHPRVGTQAGEAKRDLPPRPRAYASARDCARQTAHRERLRRAAVSPLVERRVHSPTRRQLGGPDLVFGDHQAGMMRGAAMIGEDPRDPRFRRRVYNSNILAEISAINRNRRRTRSGDPGVFVLVRRRVASRADGGVWARVMV